MTTSLSILLPVHNAEDSLEMQVSEILDVLPELTDVFDIMIVDDGSTDDTPEVAASLARRFPQVRCTRHPMRLGLNEAIQTGLDETAGDVVFVADEKYGLDPQDLRKLWQMRTSRNNETPAVTKSTWLKKFIDWDNTRHPSRAHLSVGLQMIRRDAGEQPGGGGNGPREPGGRPSQDTPPHVVEGPKPPSFANKNRRIAWKD